MDAIDFQIVQALRNNARISNKDLAQQVGLASSSCLARVRYLNEQGIIKGYHADIDTGALGINLRAMVAVRLSKHSRVQFEDFRQHLLQQVEVDRVFHLSGANDFLVEVSVNNTDHLRDFVLSAFTERSEVAHIETSLIYDTWANPELQNFT